MTQSDLRLSGFCAGVTILCLAILIRGQTPPLQFAAAIALVFYLPGFAVLRAIGLRLEGRLESLVLTVVLSLAIVIIAGLTLNLVGAITRPGWLLALGAITLGANFIRLTSRGPFTLAPASAEMSGPTRRHIRPREIALLACASILAAGAVFLALGIALGHKEFEYAELWIVPNPDDPEAVVVGLRNAQEKTENYVVELHVDRHFVQSWGDVSLNPGETWTTKFRWAGLGMYPRPVPPLNVSTVTREAPKAAIYERTSLGATPRVEALVYRSSDRSKVYRRAWIAAQCVSHDDPRGRPPCEF
jgi:uncharacterized membrane protein